MIEQLFGIAFGPTIWNQAPDASDAKHMHDTRIVLSRILGSQAGRALAASLRFHSSLVGSRPVYESGKWILLLPYDFEDCNAEATQASTTSSEPVVLFSPGTWGPGGCSNGNAATLPQEVLYHELVHAFRRMSGHLHPHNKMIDQLMHYTDTEEFLAILATNIFISDATNHHKTSLRANHESHATLDPRLADSFRFFSLGLRAFNMLATFCDENRGFTQMLAKVPARFNPLAAYYKNPRKAFEIAASGDTDYYFDEGLVPLDWVKGPDGTWKRTNPLAGVPQYRR
jgi:hypothetical protein